MPMKIRIIGSSVSGANDDQFLITYLCNDTVAIDAGCLGLIAPVETQLRVEHVFLSHAHADHTASLPVFLDNTFLPGPECARIHGLPHTLAALEGDVFNNRIWPDFVHLSVPENRFLNLSPLVVERPVEVAAISVTPIAIEHVIPTVAFLLADSRSAVAIVSDTAPTERVWQILRTEPRLKAVFLEASFPNSLHWLAEKSAHLTPALFGRELAKLARDVEIVAVHLNPRFRAEVIDDLRERGNTRLTSGQVGREYVF
jgi:ribonuclease BN (tRNA processing enzyme)